MNLQASQNIASPKPAESPNRQFLHREQIEANGWITFDVSIDSLTMQLYHQQIIKKNFLVYGFDMERPVRLEEGTIIIESDDGPNRRQCFCEGPNKFDSGMAICRRVENLSTRLERFLARNPAELSESEMAATFHQMSSYAAMILDTLGTRQMMLSLGQMLDESSPRNVAEIKSLMGDLTYPMNEIPYLIAIYRGLLGLARLEVRDGLSRFAVSEFIHGLGVLDRNDLSPCDLESPCYLQDWIERKIDRCSDDAVLRWQQHELLHGHRVSQAKVAAAERKIVRALSPHLREQGRMVIAIIKSAADFGERNRRLRCPFLRCFESWFEHRGRDPMTSPPPEACHETPTLQTIQGFFEEP